MENCFARSGARWIPPDQRKELVSNFFPQSASIFSDLLYDEGGGIASTYQRDTEPRDYQECSQVDEPRVRGMPIPRGCLPKSELIRDFQSELITPLFSVLRSLKPSSRLLIRFSPSSPLLEHSVFINPFREWSSAYLFLHWIMVLWLTNSSPS
ncbi:hypothetical protein AVEN_18282-1 [Araneus ventricosus]|uniref:Uncharacterized protein n=1 Tax=Araneus ventricosus TaxID=182803 RepID=A0A4Y2AKJ1_ARAVE|nr:hypothetical protein AVEN_18282-1 [Araneus ventricosus]